VAKCKSGRHSVARVLFCYNIAAIYVLLLFSLFIATVNKLRSKQKRQHLQSLAVSLAMSSLPSSSSTLFTLRLAHWNRAQMVGRTFEFKCSRTSFHAVLMLGL